MANPTVTSITPAYPAGQTFLKPGQSMTVTVVGADSDARTIVLTGTATDAEGNASSPATATIVISDPITFALTAPAGSGLTIAPVAGTPGAFTVSA